MNGGLRTMPGKLGEPCFGLAYDDAEAANVTQQDKIPAALGSDLNDLRASGRSF